jgi:hypothetical protein
VLTKVKVTGARNKRPDKVWLDSSHYKNMAGLLITEQAGKIPHADERTTFAQTTRRGLSESENNLNGKGV